MCKPLVLAEHEGVRRTMLGLTMGECVCMQKCKAQPIEDIGLGWRGSRSHFLLGVRLQLGLCWHLPLPCLPACPLLGAKVAEKVSPRSVPRKSDLQAEFLGKKLPHP